MGGKEEKRGACRGKSLIICLPKKPHHNRVENTPGRAGEKKRAVWGRQSDGEDEWVCI